MALSRKAEVFRRKVLEKLFPASPPDVAISSTEGRSVLQSPVSEQAGSTKASEEHPCLPDKKRMILPPRKMYTVSPPPEDYVPDGNSEVNHGSSATNDDSDASEEKYQGQPTRKRIRKKKRKNVLRNTDNPCGGQVECGKHENPTEDNLQLEHAGSQALSRNKKRKMKKKRQRARMRAAGLLTKPTGVDFTYKPEREEGAKVEEVDKKTADILDFLQTTQEIYFSDKRSKCEAPSVRSESIYEVLQRLESHHTAASDVASLHHMKSLVLLQDVERLKGAVEEFQIHSAMPPDDAKAVSLLFLYWITDILPGKNRK